MELNEEQSAAAKTRGDVLLRAGAGSGKTSVLIHHVVFLVENFIEENKDVEEATFIKSLGKYLSGIVLMTFTRKAAGEIKLRLGGLIDQKASDLESRWFLVRREMEKMTIGTIHSFCLKLLRGGFFPEAETDLSIADGYMIENKIKTLLGMWFDEEMPKCLNRGDKKASAYSVLSNAPQVEKALVKIFSDPELRRNWEAWGSRERDGGRILEDILDILGVRDVVEEAFYIGMEDLKNKGKWQDRHGEFESLKSSVPLTMETVADYADFFEGWRVPSLPRSGRTSDRTRDYFQKVGKLKKFIKCHRNHFEASLGSGVVIWEEIFREIFVYISEKYKLLPGFGYSDIEYYTLKGLENLANQKRVAEVFHSIIVDEFQDTSRIQSQIIEKVVDGDFGRLYCVGDEKQAIYGFRGGELGVFEGMQKKVKNNLMLRNNYRSAADIVEFNNSLFAGILGTGDFSQVASGESAGSHVGLCRHVLDIQSSGAGFSFNALVLEEYESRKIFSVIKDAVERGEDDDICVLYSKLTPSFRLVDKLINGGISFTAQIKIKQGDDPLVTIFRTLIEEMLKREGQGEGYCRFMVGMILKYLHSTASQETVESSIEEFFVVVPLFGMVHAFRKFILDVGIYNSNNKNNLKTIEEIVQANFEMLTTSIPKSKNCRKIIPSNSGSEPILRGCRL